DCNLSAVVEEAVENIRPSAVAKAQRLETMVEPDVMIRGDAERLHQVMWNLLTNAVKFTPVNGGITVTLSTIGGDARIIVKDTGPGMAPEALPHIFQRFWQAEGKTRDFGGLG